MLVVAEENKLRELADKVLERAKTLGATSAEVDVSLDSGFTATVRMGEIDTLEYQKDKGFAISVYLGQCKGSASTTDTSEASIEQTLKAALNIAKYTAEDPFNGLADKNLMAFDYQPPDLYYPWDLTPEQAIRLAKDCEAKGMRYDKRIVNSEGATVTSHQAIHVYANSHGFSGAFSATRHSLSCVLVAQEGQSMQRDFDYSIACDAADLQSGAEIARRAAERTIGRLGARRLKTRKAPVIFRADVARSLLGSFVSAISGGNLYRESSFLLNALGKPVFPQKFTLSEHPHLKKALGSAPFDQEGVRTQERDIVKNGVLQSYVLSSYAARKLGMQPTGNAGGVHNLGINAGDLSLDDLLRKMHCGVLVTELIGHGVNIVTGDYSRGAAGFWIENGKIAYPVEEITIAGNLKDMFLNLVAVANDVDVRGNVRSGSMLIAEMMIAGE